MQFRILFCLSALTWLGPAYGFRPLTIKSQAVSADNETWAKQAVSADNETWAETISWTPRAALWHNFMTEEECDHLVKLAKSHLQKSMVVDSLTGKSKLDEVRTSSGMFLLRGQDDVIKGIEEKIALRTMIPAGHGEGLQILRYNNGETYRSHMDYFHDELNQQNGGQRVATMLMYLSDVEAGGETVFPDSANKPTLGDSAFSDCAQAGAAVKPKKGDALFFYSLQPNAGEDPTSLHGGCPVLQGVKWSATKWMRVRNYAA